MKKNITWIIVIIIILVVLAIIFLNAPKAIAPGTSGDEAVIPNEETEEGKIEALEGAEQVVPDASPVSKKGEVLTPEGALVDNTVLPGSSEAPKQSRALDEKEIPLDAVKLTVTESGFIPNEFTVKVGQAITLSLTSGDKTHVFKFDNALLKAIAIGVTGQETRAITFNTPVAGDYTFYCAVPDHRERGETGVMHVK